MLAPFLVIGVGGIGGRAVGSLHDQLSKRLRAAGGSGEIPAGWQLLHVDAALSAEGGAGEFVPVTVAGSKYGPTHGGLVPARRAAHDVAPYLGWVPEPGTVRVPIARGSGQFRAIGRVMSLAASTAIADAIRTAAHRVTSVAGKAELEHASELLGIDPSLTHPPMAVLVGSTAGGVGSGALLDIAEILHGVGPAWCRESVGILFTSDVFGFLPEIARSGCEANSLAFVSELMSGALSVGRDRGEISALGHLVPDGPRSGGGIRHPILVASRNEGFAFADADQAAASVGRAVATLMTAPSVTTTLFAHMHNAWWRPGAALPVASFGPASLVRSGPFAALGSATISLGRDRFADHATNRLVQATVDQLLRGHLSPGDEREPSEHLHDAAHDAWRWFCGRCGLSPDPGTDQPLINALQPARDPEVPALRDEAMSELRRLSDAPTTVWAERIGRQVEAMAFGYRHRTRNYHQIAARAWVDAVARDVERATVMALSRPRCGARVALELLERLRRHVGEVAEAMDAEAAVLSAGPDRADRAIASQLTSMRRRKQVAPVNPVIDEAVRHAVHHVLAMPAMADARRLAADLLRDLADGLVQPLWDALDQATARLQFEDDDRERGPGSSSSEPPVAPNEFLLEDPSSFPDTYDALIAACVDGPELLAVAEVIGTTERDAPWLASTRWSPRALAGEDPPSRASYQPAADLSTIHRRAADWVRRPDHPMGEHVGRSLREYLEEASSGPRAIRRTKLMSAFEAALAAARPLATLSPELLVLLEMGGDPPVTYAHTSIPLAGTDLELQIRDLLLTTGIDGRSGAADGFGHGRETTIEIVTFLSRTYDPIVFDSLMRPIGDAWRRRWSSPDDVARFWAWRRARPLTSFVPVPPDVRRAMAVGWLVAVIVGAVTTDADEEPDTVTLNDPSTGHPFPFPSPLLRSAAPASLDLLGAVLESMPLAMVECNASRHLGALEAYVRLADLGSDAAQDTVSRWVARGATGDTRAPTQRLDAARARWTAWQQAWQTGHDARWETPDGTPTPLWWELHGDIETGLRVLADVLDRCTAEHLPSS